MLEIPQLITLFSFMYLPMVLPTPSYKKMPIPLANALQSHNVTQRGSDPNFSKIMGLEWVLSSVQEHGRTFN